MKCRRTLAILLCLLLLAAIPAAAAGESRQPLQLCLSSASAPAGGEAELTLSLENNPGVAAIFADLSYDGSLLAKAFEDGNGLLRIRFARERRGDDLRLRERQSRGHDQNGSRLTSSSVLVHAFTNPVALRSKAVNSPW